MPCVHFAFAARSAIRTPSGVSCPIVLGIRADDTLCYFYQPALLTYNNSMCSNCGSM